MSFFFDISPGADIRAARAELKALERQLIDASAAEDQDQLRDEIDELRADLNRVICLRQQHIGWR
jgi:hypothetical protein